MSGHDPAWTDLDDLGPFFAVEVGDEPDPAWLPLLRLADDPGVLDARVHGGRQLLARLSGVDPEQVEQRVVVSVVTLGLLGRVLAPALAMAVLHRRLPDLDAMRFQLTESGPLPLSSTGSTDALPDDDREAAAALEARVLDRLARPLLEHAAAAARLAPSLLAGNLASALAGADAAIARSLPAAALRSRALTLLLLQTPPLSGSGAYEPESGQFRRRTCCLYYRVAGGGTCGDCPLPAARR